MPENVTKSTSRKVSETYPLDKDYLYGRYQRSVDGRVEANNERLKWENQLGKQLAHKAVDEPLMDSEDVGVNVRNTSTSTGLGWRELAVIAGMILGTGATTAYFTGQRTETPVMPQADQPPGSAIQPSQDRDTIVKPGIRFGPIPTE